MLGSITPLGERGRGRRWGLTVAGYVTASTVGGAGFGGVMGALGAGISAMVGRPGRVGLVALGVLVMTGVGFELGLIGPRLPSVRRQVNEEWLRRYRGWVYGVGFGFQLGAGVATIVSTSAVYLTFAAALLSGTVMAGALIGGFFGLLRAVPLMATARVRRPEQLAAVDGALRRWDRPIHRIAVGGQAAIAAVLLAAAVM